VLPMIGKKATMRLPNTTGTKKFRDSSEGRQLFASAHMSPMSIETIVSGDRPP